MNSAQGDESDDAAPGSRNSQRAASASQAVKELGETATGRASGDRATEIEERWENRLAWPVLIAAIVSVPAVFLTLLDEPFEMIGHIGLWLATVVLVAETVVLFLVSWAPCTS